MQVPIRKPGKFTHQKKDPHITEKKFNELENRLAKMKKDRPTLIKEVQRAAQFGDFSENAEYQIAKGKLRGMNQRMLEIEEQLKKAVIIKQDQKHDKVKIGSKVTIEINNKEKTYIILGSTEADPSKGIISQNSPIGSALIGHKVDEVIKISLADKKAECRIIKIG